MMTVLLTTFNGAGTLPETLESLSHLHEPRGGWKLVVADDGSEDETPAILRAFHARLPKPPTILSGPHRGLNATRNDALAHVSGDLVAFTDDDVIVHPDWLVQIRTTADAHPEVAIFGGAIRPHWEVSPAPWHRDWVPLAACYSALDDGVEGPCEQRYVFGPNMTIRASVFEQGFRFSPAIGPDGSPFYAMGAETELLLRLKAAGYRMWHCPRAVVEHRVRPIQLTEHWILGRAERSGAARQALGRTGLSPEAWGIAGFTPHLALTAGRWWVRARWAGLTGRPRERFLALWEYHVARGIARQRARTR